VHKCETDIDIQPLYKC